MSGRSFSAGDLADLAAGAETDDAAATLQRLVQTRDGFLGVPGIADDKDQAAAADPVGQVIAADGHHRARQLGVVDGCDDVGADGGTAHAGDRYAADFAAGSSSTLPPAS